MLKGISPYFSPELLKTLYEMGHADEVVLADAHFPGHTVGRRVVRADALNVSQLLHAILPLFELERTDDALVMMQPDGGDAMNSEVEADFLTVVRKPCAADDTGFAHCEAGLLRTREGRVLRGDDGGVAGLWQFDFEEGCHAGGSGRPRR